jgi:hypothetical protein
MLLKCGLLNEFVQCHSDPSKTTCKVKWRQIGRGVGMANGCKGYGLRK